MERFERSNHYRKVMLNIQKSAEVIVTKRNEIPSGAKDRINILKDAKAKGDDKTVGIGKLALLALALAQFLLLISDISAMMRKRNEEKIDEYEEE